MSNGIIYFLHLIVFHWNLTNVGCFSRRISKEHEELSKVLSFNPGLGLSNVASLFVCLFVCWFFVPYLFSSPHPHHLLQPWSDECHSSDSECCLRSDELCFIHMLVIRWTVFHLVWYSRMKWHEKHAVKLREELIYTKFGSTFYITFLERQAVVKWILIGGYNGTVSDNWVSPVRCPHRNMTFSSHTTSHGPSRQGEWIIIGFAATLQLAEGLAREE